MPNRFGPEPSLADCSNCQPSEEAEEKRSAAAFRAVGSVNSKQDQILQGAMHVFMQHGYADTSMDRVAATAGVSKQTIYSHFQDKEGLFRALIERVTIQRIKAELGEEFGIEPLQGKPSKLLRRLAEAFLHKMTDQEYLALLRVVIGESVRFPELTQLYTKTVVQRGCSMLTTYLRSHPELNIPDAEAAARIFVGSLVSFVIAQEILYGKLSMPMEQERYIDSLIEMMLSRASDLG